MQRKFSKKRKFFSFSMVRGLNQYRVFSHDVTAAILMSQNNETVAMVSQINPLGVKLFSYANHFFCYNTFAWMLATCVKTLYFFVVFGDFLSIFFFFGPLHLPFFAAFRFLTGSTGFHSHVSCFSSYRAVQDVILRDIFLTAGRQFSSRCP